MSYSVVTIPNFDKELKRLARKYPSLRIEIASLVEKLEKNPFEGTDLGNNVRKIRLSIQSKGTGKRGGARLITYIKIVEETLYLLSIYNKGAQDTITAKEITKLISDVNILCADAPQLIAG
ncbi:hypothetical protein SAMD00024442_1_86 [Candidatus Symbiothrix dinenymphae]|nr:hypothetical protein SAMD00024442_1_86 [Candidatus Symbiothrix dinenymphae]